MTTVELLQSIAETVDEMLHLSRTPTAQARALRRHKTSLETIEYDLRELLELIP